jgi:deazaflavin-dependent oxidoreductase (nitroreductase family)
MPIPRVIARFNRIGLNRVVLLIAPWLPGFGVIEHVGRRSGRVYRTPVNVFRRGRGYVVALTYGLDVDWLKNAQAAGGCELETRRRRVQLGAPHVYRDTGRRDVPALVAHMLIMLNAADFAAFDVVQA